jgi:hypothetical protein
MEFELTDGKVNFDKDFQKDMGLDPSTHPAEYLLYWNLRVTARVNDSISALEKRIMELEGIIKTMPEDFIHAAEERRRRRNTL